MSGSGRRLIEMAFIDAVAALNGLKRRRIVRDYAIIGAVAATAYMEPIFTEDLEVAILVDTDEECRRVFGTIAEESESQEGMHQILGGVPVQIFPTTVMPLYLDTVEKARKVRIGNVRAKVATVEHLVVLYLISDRQRDRMRISYLLDGIDEVILGGLLKEFDDEKKTLAHKLTGLRGTSVPGEGEVASPQKEDESGP